jgi:tetratricopeptide (TPR) repeat protein
MPAVAPIVFLSSRFKEFDEHRTLVTRLLRDKCAVPCHVINCNENQPDGDPPLAISLDAARRADIMVLLLGRTYGLDAPGEKRSYVHLEYEAARRRGKAVVLPFIFGFGKHPPAEPRLLAFRKEIFARHTAAKYDDEVSAEAVAFHIFQEVQRRAFSIASAVTRLDADVWITADEELSAEEAEQAMEQDRRIREHPELQLGNESIQAWNTSKLLLNPTLIAAAEQKRHALAALGLGEWRLARRHLSQALEHAPLDLPALFWHARLLLITGSRDDSTRALSSALRGLRIAEAAVHETGSSSTANILAVACYMLAARASEQLDDASAAVRFANEARSAAPTYWLTHYELARQYAAAGNESDARETLRSAFYLRPTSLWAAKNDPAFSNCRRMCQRLRHDVRTEVREQVHKIVAAEVYLSTEATRPGDNKNHRDLFCDIDASIGAVEILPTLEDLTVFQLISAAKDSFIRQVETLSRLATASVELAGRHQAETGRLEAIDGEFAPKTAKLERQIEVISGAQFSATVPSSPRVLSTGLIVAAAVGGLGILLIRGHHPLFGWSIVVAAALLTGFVFWMARAVSRDNAEKRFKEWQKQKVEQLQDALATLNREYSVRSSVATKTTIALRDALQTTVLRFTCGVASLEELCLYRRILGPTSALDTAAPGDLVRLDPSKHKEYAVAEALLPEILSPWGSDQSVPTHGHRLFRVTAAKPNGAASRMACYFDPKDCS